MFSQIPANGTSELMPSLTSVHGLKGIHIPDGFHNHNPTCPNFTNTPPPHRSRCEGLSIHSRTGTVRIGYLTNTTERTNTECTLQNVYKGQG